jgi:hypothetical protein
MHAFQAHGGTLSVNLEEGARHESAFASAHPAWSWPRHGIVVMAMRLPRSQSQRNPALRTGEVVFVADLNHSAPAGIEPERALALNTGQRGAGSFDYAVKAH